jgi:hypothetical protein
VVRRWPFPSSRRSGPRSVQQWLSAATKIDGSLNKNGQEQRGKTERFHIPKSEVNELDQLIRMAEENHQYANGEKADS